MSEVAVKYASTLKDNPLSLEPDFIVDSFVIREGSDKGKLEDAGYVFMSESEFKDLQRSVYPRMDAFYAELYKPAPVEDKPALAELKSVDPKSLDDASKLELVEKLTATVLDLESRLKKLEGL